MICADNPLHVEIVQTLVPVANEVRIEVRAEEVVDPKREQQEDPEQREQVEESLIKKCEKMLDYIYIVFLILIILGILAGLCLLLAWMSLPNLFGTQQV
jgi:hypothetical protein